MNRKYVLGLILLALMSCSGPDVFDTLPKVVSAVNEKCPKMIDSETRLDAVELRGEDTLVYHYTLVNILVSQVDTALFYRALWPGIVSNIRISAEMKKLREVETKFVYSYQDKAGKQIYRFRISPGDYR